LRQCEICGIFPRPREIGTTAAPGWRIRRHRQKITQVPDIWTFLELFAEDSQHNVYTGGLEVRPPRAPTTEAGTQGLGHRSEITIFEFVDETRLAYQRLGYSRYIDGLWRQNAGVLLIEINDCYAVYEGRIEGDEIEDDFANEMGARASWTARRKQGSVSTATPKERPPGGQPSPASSAKFLGRTFAPQPPGSALRPRNDDLQSLLDWMLDDWATACSSHDSETVLALLPSIVCSRTSPSAWSLGAKTNFAASRTVLLRAVPDVRFELTSRLAAGQGAADAHQRGYAAVRRAHRILQAVISLKHSKRRFES